MTLIRVSCVALALAIGPVARAQPATATAPATTEATTKPATGPTTQEEPKTVKVEKGTVSPVLQTVGTFEPVDPFELRVRPKVFKGELKIVASAPNGAGVKAGDVLLQLDTEDVQRELDAAENELATARANHEKAVGEAKVGKEADTLAMRIQQQAVDTAKAELDWWDKVIGPQIIKQADLGVKQGVHNVEDQEDELDQLRKMYKDEELTSATADIVVKRAVRQLELSKEYLSMTKETAEKSKTLDHDVAREKVVDALDQARQQLDALKVAQQHGQATRQTAVVSAQQALSAAEKKAKELKEDRDGMTVKAPYAGKLIYGQLAESQWKNSDPKTLRPGEKVPAEQVLMTLAPPQKLNVVLNVPEAALAWLTPGMKASVHPVSAPETKLTGTTVAPAPAGKGEGPEQTFRVLVEFDQPLDPRIEPGRKAAVRVAGPKAKDVLTLPAEAVAGGVVKVRSNGETVDKEVTVGRSDGKKVEIVDGLKEGDEVVTEEAK